MKILDSKKFCAKLFAMKNAELTQALLNWYDKNGRNLPWRHKGGAHPNPYAVAVSEIMLQQTTVNTVKPYFEKFMERFPSVYDLAQATEDEVYQYWQGLGYYSRARSLHKTAQIVVTQYNGNFPQTRAEVAKLKGFGTYTIASFLALAYNLPETVIDGNVMRIMCRLHHWTKPLELLQDKIAQAATDLSSKIQAADYASAIMDLGATVCTPKKPHCLICPWQNYCQSANAADVEKIPLRQKIEKKEFNGYVYLVFNAKGEVLIRKRTEKGVLQGLYEFPWSEKQTLYAKTRYNSGKTVSHVFTHIKMKLQILTIESEDASDGIFVSLQKIGDYPMSSLMKKVWLSYKK